jgi:hypothetical protein
LKGRNSPTQENEPKDYDYCWIQGFRLLPLATPGNVYTVVSKSLDWGVSLMLNMIFLLVSLSFDLIGFGRNEAANNSQVTICDPGFLDSACTNERYRL